MKTVKVLVIALILTLGVIVPSRVTTAQSGSGGNGLSITPTRFDLVIEPGGNDIVDMQIKNVADTDILAKAYLNDFEADGNTGNPKLIVDNSVRSASSISEFVVDFDDVLVKAGETVAVNVPIAIPENAAPGAYYGALRFQASSPEEAGSDDESPQVSLNASVAVLVLIEVPGNITEKIEIADMSAYLDGKSGSFFTATPDQIGVEINNLGNGFSKPFGTVRLNGPWGTGEITSYELNNVSPKGNILPGQPRLFLNSVEGIKWPGRYTISGDISHGRGGEILSIQSSFWYVPAWVLITLLVILLGLALLGYYMFRKYATKSTRRRR